MDDSFYLWKFHDFFYLTLFLKNKINYITILNSHLEIVVCIECRCAGISCAAGQRAERTGGTTTDANGCRCAEERCVAVRVGT